MLLAHLSDLHLGHRAYERIEGGKNVREQDVARSFQRAVEGVIRLEPDLIFLVGDIFDRPDPSPGALVALARGLEAFRGALPAASIFMVAGARDTPPALLDPAALAALDAFPGVEVATGEARSVFLPGLQAHVCMAPHAALVEPPLPDLRPRPDARWNLLVAYADARTGEGPGIPLDPTSWDYIALGHVHQHQQVTPRAHYSGALERVGPEPWREAAQEKGFLTFDLEEGRARFHPIPGRAVVALAPIRFHRGESARLPRKIREVLDEVPGGIDGKIVRLRVEGLSPEEVRGADDGLFVALRERALHLAVEVDDFPGVGEDNRLPLMGRDRGFALRALRARIAERGEQGEALLSLLEEVVGDGPGEEPAHGLEEALVVRELDGERLPTLGNVRMKGGEGLLGWVGGDGRTLRALVGTLLWGVQLVSDLPGYTDGRPKADEPRLALRIGGRGEGVRLRRGFAQEELGTGPLDACPPSWGLPREGVALAWCGAGADGPEEVVAGGGALLAAARGVGELAALDEALLAKYPALRRDRALGDLSARDYERLRLEAEAADLETQRHALEDVPRAVAELESELREARSQAVEVAGDVEAATMEWHKERQDAETNLLAYRDRGRELRKRIRSLETLGPESSCPTCGRVLEDRFAEVLAELEEEWEKLVQDGKWWRRRWEQLEEKPPVVREMEGLSVRLNARLEDCMERLERSRSSLRELDELRVREKEVRARLEGLLTAAEGTVGPGLPMEDPARWNGEGEGEAMAPEVGELTKVARRLREEMHAECRTRLVLLGGRRLNRITGGRILGLRLSDENGEIELVDVGGSAGVEAEEDRAAAVVALRMALVELLAEEWGPLGSLILADPFDHMAGEDQLRALGLLRRIASRIPQVLLLTRGSVVERASELFDGLSEIGEGPRDGGPPLRSHVAGVGTLRLL